METELRELRSVEDAMTSLGSELREATAGLQQAIREATRATGRHFTTAGAMVAETRRAVDRSAVASREMIEAADKLQRELSRLEALSSNIDGLQKRIRELESASAELVKRRP